MRAFTTDIEDRAKDNKAFRSVLFTGNHLQLVLMSLKPGEEIGSEIHNDHDQFFKVEDGVAIIVLEESEVTLDGDSVIIIPAGVRHNVVNPSKYRDLKLFTIYGPPAHPYGTHHETKEEAEAGERLSV